LVTALLAKARVAIAVAARQHQEQTHFPGGRVLMGGPRMIKTQVTDIAEEQALLLVCRRA